MNTKNWTLSFVVVSLVSKFTYDIQTKSLFFSKNIPTIKHFCDSLAISVKFHITNLRYEFILSRWFNIDKKKHYIRNQVCTYSSYHNWRAIWCENSETKIHLWNMKHILFSHPICWFELKKKTITIAKETTSLPSYSYYLFTIVFNSLHKTIMNQF